MSTPTRDLHVISGRAGEALLHLRGPYDLVDRQKETRAGGWLVRVYAFGISSSIERRAELDGSAQWSVTDPRLPAHAARLDAGIRDIASPVGTIGAASFVGDANGDGEPEVAIAGSGMFPTMGNTRGSVALLCGATGTPIWTVESSTYGEQLGRGVSPCGDVDGDGLRDVCALVAVYPRQGPDRIEIFSGSDGLLIRSIEVEDLRPSWLRSTGDITRDGCQELLVESEDAFAVFSTLGNRIEIAGSSPRWAVPWIAESAGFDQLVVALDNPAAQEMELVALSKLEPQALCRVAAGIVDLEKTKAVAFQLAPSASPGVTLIGRSHKHSAFGRGQVLVLIPNE
jgi:hypothetical protein